MTSDHADRVYPRLTVGNADAARQVREDDYDRVFSVADELTVDATTDTHDLHVNERVHDQVDELRTAVASLQEALEDGEECFVHCWQGMERAPTVSAAAIARTRDIEFSEALEIIELGRPLTNPTPELHEVGRQVVDAPDPESEQVTDG